jgi:hypothetical protein
MNQPETPSKPPATTVEEEWLALHQMLEAMKRLDREAQSRVMRYLKDRFSVYLSD